jgi:hypothetical protein
MVALNLTGLEGSGIVQLVAKQEGKEVTQLAIV